MTLTWFILIFAFCCTWAAIGMFIASFYANIYAFMNLASPPAWKVYLVIVIWPITVVSVLVSSLREKIRKRI